MSHEFAEGTWDGQRLSSLSAWEMAWGKLFGCALAAWYDGFMCLCVFAAAALFLGWQPHDVALSIWGAAMFALALHAASLMSPLSAHWQGRKPGSGVAGIFVFCLVAFNFSSRLFGLKHLEPATRWWGLEIPNTAFGAVSMSLLAAWALAGAWLAMRRELQESPSATDCLWWPAFLAFWFFWAMGFFIAPQGGPDLAIFLSTATVVLWASVYLQLFWGRKNQVHWQRFFSAWQRRDWARAGALFPDWLSGFALALAASAATAFAGHPAPMLMPIVALFAVRDIALVLWLNLNPKLKRPNGLAVILLLALYLLAPLFFGDTALRSAFLPLLFDFNPKKGLGNLFIGIILPAAQAALFLWLLKARWEALEEHPPTDSEKA
jgi:hypothetical protein